MHCSQIRKRIVDLQGNLSADDCDREYRAHLENCPDCAAFARAERLLHRDLAEASADDNAGGIPLSALKTRITATTPKMIIKENIMTRISHQIKRRPRLMASLALALTVFMFISLVPLPYTQTVGYNLSISGTDLESKIQPEILSAAFAASGHDAVEVNFEKQESLEVCTFTNLPTESDARVLAEALSEISGSILGSKIERITRTIAGTIYAQVAESIKPVKPTPMKIGFTDNILHLDGESIGGAFRNRTLSDGEVKAKIEALLSEKGIDISEISVLALTNEENTLRTIAVMPKNLDSLGGDSLVTRIIYNEYAMGMSYEGDLDTVGGRLPIEIEVAGRTDTLRCNAVVMTVTLDGKAVDVHIEEE